MAALRTQKTYIVQCSSASLRSPGCAVADPSGTLPRLGSRVRIPSPAPDFLRKIRDFQAALQGRFCFQGPFGGNSEAERKLHAESRRRRNRRFGGSNLESKRLWAADSTGLASPAAQRATNWCTARNDGQWQDWPRS